MKLNKYVLLALLTGSLTVCSASPGPVIAEAADSNPVSVVDAQAMNSYSLDFDASKNYTEETLTLCYLPLCLYKRPQQRSVMYK